MAKKEPLFPHPNEVRGAMWTTPMSGEMRLLYGLGALLLGATAIRFMPKVADKIVPMLVSAFTPPPGFQALPFQPHHPEAAEPIVTLIDERQLGRSEVVREIANPKGN